MSRTTKKTKTFDCVEFKRHTQARLYEATREMSTEQQREHVRRIVETGPLADFWRRVTQQSKTAPKAGRL
ncbi:MAG: hypothetical protein GY778_19930 [bacterium]|nr:hypothetical protein [bacterium]